MNGPTKTEDGELMRCEVKRQVQWEISSQRQRQETLYVRRGQDKFHGVEI